MPLILFWLLTEFLNFIGALVIIFLNELNGA